MAKLKVGDVVEVFGYVMLKKIESGRYRVSKIETVNNQSVYSFTKPRGKKVLVRHYSDFFDTWVKESDDSNLNKIVLIKE